MRRRIVPIGRLVVLVAVPGMLAGCGSREGAPPGMARTGGHLETAALAQCSGTDVHQVHLSRFACAVCHPKGGDFGFATPYVFPRGTTTAGGTLVVGTAPAPTTCTVGCHFPMGGASRSIVWTTPGPLDCTACHDTSTTLSPAHPQVSATAPRADCLVCHDVATHAVGSGAVALVPHAPGWMDPASASFHASSANRGLASCQGCHAQDLGGGVTGFSCGQCHDQRDAAGNVVVGWKTNCVMCHGGTNDQTGAPPKAIWGYAAESVRVGAHGKHVAGSALAPPYDCGVCHVKPGDALASDHIDEVPDGSAPVATVSFAGVATQGLAQRGIAPAWDRASASCSGTYCHGATISGGTLKSPVWTTVDGSQAACGTCHGVPPPSPHPGVDLTAGLKACNPCHSATVDTSGAVIPPSAGGKHLDGAVEATGHAAAWMDVASAGFHAFSADSNIASCQACHGTNLDGIGGTASTACGSCHDRNLPAGATSWKTSCIMCHGGTDNPTGAPPKAIWGYSGDPARGGGTADPVRVGAHTAHVTGTLGGTALSAAFDCGVCHPKPADALSAGHLDGTIATVAFTGLASQGTAASPPAWTRASATCANVYCHGATLQGGTNTAPSWTGGPQQAACGACHGVPPPPSAGHVQNADCGTCHPGYTQTSVNPAKHVNGAVDLAGLTCTTCHGDPSRPATALNPQLASAPPWDTAGNADPSSPRVGAHQAHLNDGPLGAAIACTECHTVPVSTVTHPTGTVDLTWGTLASAGGARPSWNRAAATCASTYCHGNYAGVYTYTVWDYGSDQLVEVSAPYAGLNATPTWTGSPMTCTSCHGNPPAATGVWHSGQHGNGTVPGANDCQLCHPDATSTNGSGATITNPAMHVNGTVDVTPRWSTKCFPCH